jgi:hypothetical protein
MSLIPTIKEKLNLLKETVEDTQDNFIFLKMQMPKQVISQPIVHFGYKTHTDNDRRTHYSSRSNFRRKGDGPELPKLLEISQENGIDVDTIIGDVLYRKRKSNLQVSKILKW